MKYDVEADWILLTTCNFQCKYCFFPPTFLASKLRTYGTPAQWGKGFKDTGKTWLLHITGGEPTLYPGFVDLCDELTQNHYLSINSNLSNHSISTFARRISPERIHFINAAVHLEERQKRRSLDVFIERVNELRGFKFCVLLSLVMTPNVIDTFDKISERFEANGLYIIPKVIRGRCDGSKYPYAYSDKQKRIIHEHITRAKQMYDPMLSGMNELPTINMFSDYLFLDGVKDYRGLLCSAGYKFVKISPDGTVGRCESTMVLGNILSSSVRLLDEPTACDTTYCPYFCEKYSLQPSGVFSYLRAKMLKLSMKIQNL